MESGNNSDDGQMQKDFHLISWPDLSDAELDDHDDNQENNQQLQNKSTCLGQEGKSQSMTYQQIENRIFQELKSLKIELEDKLSMKECKHAQQWQEERDRLYNLLKEQERRYEMKRRETENTHHEYFETLEGEAKALEERNKALLARQTKLESDIRDMKSKVIFLEDCHQEKYRSMHSEAQIKQSHIRDVDSRINDLKAEIRNRDKNIERLTEQNEKERELRKKMEEKIYLAKRVNDDNERTVKCLQRAKEESDHIILSLQDEIKKLKSQIDSDAEYKLTIEEETSDLYGRLESKTRKIKSLKDEVSYLKDEMAKLKEKIGMQDRVIQCLNRENRTRIIPNVLPAPTSPIVAQKQLAEGAPSVTMKPSSPDNRCPVVAANKKAGKSVRFMQTIDGVGVAAQNYNPEMQGLDTDDTAVIALDEKLQKMGMKKQLANVTCSAIRSPAITANKTTGLSVKVTKPPQKRNKSNQTPSRFRWTEGTDSGYFIATSDLIDAYLPPNKPNTADNR